jgi:cupin 2 domain-containing protein
VSDAGNIFTDLPAPVLAEQIRQLLSHTTLKIERIVSHGQASPPGFWYDQDQAEWVIVLSGSAGLQFEGEDARTLRAGDYVNIPAHTRHRVEWTDSEHATIWLAIHYR